MNLTGITKKEFKFFLNRTRKIVKKYLGYKIKFKTLAGQSIKSYFKIHQGRFKTKTLSIPSKLWFIDIYAKRHNELILNAVTHVVKKEKHELIEKYFGSLPKNKLNKSYIIFNKFKNRLDSLYKQKDLSGKDLLSASNKERLYHFSFGHWISLINQEKEADFIITNSMIAAADPDMPLYVLNRGGITSGFVENNEFRPFGAGAVIGLLPFIFNGEYFKKVRGSWPKKEALGYAAFLMAHEIGHFLARKKEGYKNAGSLHQAAKDLNYKSWVNLIKEKHFKLDYDPGTLKHF